MNKIIKLPKQISDKIAAGEVVTGPISVVKELVENSIDAGSDSIVVEIKDGGKTYIRITDNGSGIPSEQVELAFMPHATSKISSEDDLNNINTLGFRGEALTSIAAISKLELITKTEDERVGTSVYIEGGDIIERKDMGANNGTTIIVKDLFFNTPARLKFMKSDRSESTKIIDLISRMAIAYPKIKFRLINNDNILFSTTGKGDTLNNIFQVYGTETKDDLMELIVDEGDYKLSAFISPSNYTKKSRRNQIYFVNGRVVNSKTIETAVSKGYEEFLFEGRYPVTYLFLEINPSKLDVNVHPAKTEVRFNEQPVLNEFIYRNIRNKLRTKEAMPNVSSNSRINTNKESVFELNPDAEKEITTNEQNKSKVEQVNIKSLLSTTSNNEAKNVNKVAENELLTYDTSSLNNLSESDSKDDSSANIPSGLRKSVDIRGLRVIDSIFATYIIATDEDILYIIDQHAAHERVNYELFLNQYHKNNNLSQQILNPIVLNVSITSMNNIEPWLEIINKLGYEAEVFGDKSIIIKAVPAFLEFIEAENMIKDIVDNMGVSPPENHKAIEKLIQRSCKASVKANDLLKPEEIKTLLNDLSKCDNPYACPHGRPIFVKMTKYDVEKLFKRV